jgi:hypothetical protein
VAADRVLDLAEELTLEPGEAVAAVQVATLAELGVPEWQLQALAALRELMLLHPRVRSREALAEVLQQRLKRQ